MKKELLKRLKHILIVIAIIYEIFKINVRQIID